MSFSQTVNVNDCGQSQSVTPGTFNVRAFYDGQQDAGHLFGTFTSRERAEACAQVLAGREDVQSAIVEEVVS